jgi:hypothetical protein
MLALVLELVDQRIHVQVLIQEAQRKLGRIAILYGHIAKPRAVI